ncbi:hypothetical protein TWF970_002812 [Orbilia oligospora]|uniref:DUF7580 domain-containing protein n=1 Tax=Orbilia oligospora TaxID=2813651 RepID=A0A7C8RF74_ORBOL|nr:hypothetical protein TWF970_002812 [Orbilia oligospora]
MEVAGVVLGALPIIYGAVQVYKDGKKGGTRFFQKRNGVKKLANSLLFHKGTLTEVVRKLLISSGCDDAGDLDENPFDFLKDPDIQNQLHDYLGAETELVFATKLNEACKTIQKIARSIAGLVPGLKDPTDDLHKIIEENRVQKEKQIDFVPRIKLVFKGDDLGDAIKDLDSILDGLYRFIQVTCENRQPVAEKPSRNASKLAVGFRRIQTLANNVHLAICRSWKIGCHTQHDARLFLDDRLEAAVKIAAKKEPKSALSFRLVFGAETYPSKPIWHETTVEVTGREDEDDDGSICAGSSGACRVTVIAPQIISTKRTVTVIDDICATIEAFTFTQRRVSFVVAKDQRIGSISNDLNCFHCFFQGDEVSLETLLSRCPPGSRSCLIPYDQRIPLALRLASNILQLFRTQWLQRPWCKDSIYFPISTSGTKHGPDFGKPFVSVPIDNGLRIASTQNNTDIRSIILELGILLLEIWHEVAFENQYNSINTSGMHEPRRTFAFDWMMNTTNPPPPLYKDAITYCIFGINHGESRYWDSEDPKLWRALCQNIIHPLSKICKLWGGPVVDI